MLMIKDVFIAFRRGGGFQILRRARDELGQGGVDRTSPNLVRTWRKHRTVTSWS